MLLFFVTFSQSSVFRVLVNIETCDVPSIFLQSVCTESLASAHFFRND